jgi:hypothetical protein
LSNIKEMLASEQFGKKEPVSQEIYLHSNHATRTLTGQSEQRTSENDSDEQS